MNNSIPKPDQKTLDLDYITIVWNSDGSLNNIYDPSIGNARYTIDGREVVNAIHVKNSKMVILETSQKAYFRDLFNQEIEKSDTWIDYYYERYTHAFYRQDRRGIWYDVEGYRVKSTYILKGDVLCSLNGRVSLKNMVFLDQDLVTSLNERLVQVGKIVFDECLDSCLYFNEKITGLGTRILAFENGNTYQEIKLGIHRKAFINEETKEAFTIKGDEIIALDKEVSIGGLPHFIVRSTEQQYIISVQNEEIIDFTDSHHILYPDSIISFGGEDYMKIKTSKNTSFYTLSTARPMLLDCAPGQAILKMSNSNLAIQNDNLINISTASESFVWNGNTKEKYILSDGSQPEKVKNIPGFENFLGYAMIKGQQHVFSCITNELIIIDQNETIQSLDGHSNEKLLNATTTLGRKVVLDLRNGIKNLSVATSEGRHISSVLGTTHSIGSKVLLNATVETLGGSQPRTLNLNDEELSEFTFPSQMKTYSDGDINSVFCNTPLLDIDFENPITIDQYTFLKGRFRSFDDELQTVVLSANTAKPLFLDGLGHKNELVTGFIDFTLENAYNLGPHRLIGVMTLKEDLKQNQLLFALDIMSSWIPFYDGYLPILRRIIPLNKSGAWEYHLLELGEISTDKEYIAIERNAPYRILIENNKKKKIPRVVTGKDKSLKSPEQISIVKNLFIDDPGILVEIY